VKPASSGDHNHGHKSRVARERRLNALNTRFGILASIATTLALVVAVIALIVQLAGSPATTASPHIDASVPPTAPASPSPTTRIPASTNEPSFDAPYPSVECKTLTIESGQGIGLGCDPQKQLTGSAELRYLAPKILAGSSGRFVEAYPRGQGPSYFYHSCFQQPTTPLTQFDTETAADSDSYFCYTERQLVVFVKFRHIINKSSVEIELYEWLPS
jgi:hypothetical protein